MLYILIKLELICTLGFMMFYTDYEIKKEP